MKRIPWIHAPQLKESRFDNPDTNKRPIQDIQTKVITNQLDQFDTKDVEQVWNLIYQQTIKGNYNAPKPDEVNSGHTTNYHHQLERTTDQPIYRRKSGTRIWGVQCPNATVTHNQTEQPTTHNTPIFMVAIRNGPNVGLGRFIRDFRSRNIPDRQLTIRSTRETSGTTIKPRKGSSFTINYGEISENLSRETLIKTPTAFTLRLNDDQGIRPRPPKNQRTTSISPLGWYRPTFQNIPHLTWEENGTSTTSLSLITGMCIAERLGPLAGTGPGTRVGPYPNSLTQREHTFPVSTQVEGLAPYPSLGEGTHGVENRKVKYDQPPMENTQDTSHRETERCVPNQQTSPTPEMNDHTMVRGQPLSKISWRIPTHGSTTDPTVPNQKKDHTSPAKDTFTRYPIMIENSNRETITLSKELLDQWMVRHGAYEQPNNPPSERGGGMNIQRQGTHYTIPAINGTSKQTAEGSTHTHNTEYRNLKNPNHGHGTE